MTTVQDKLFTKPSYGLISRLAGFARYIVRPRARLDIRYLSPHLLRDLGFLDGNDPTAKHH